MYCMNICLPHNQLFCMAWKLFCYCVNNIPSYNPLVTVIISMNCETILIGKEANKINLNPICLGSRKTILTKVMNTFF
jgi:hypothetical protein